MLSRRGALLSGLSFVGLAAVGAVAAPGPGFFTPYDKAGFAKAGAGGQTLLVHVHADWCSTCQAQKSVLNELLTEPAFKNLVPIVVNYDTDAEFKTAYRTPNRSTILLFRNGKEIGRVGGVTGKDDIKAFLVTTLEKSA